MRLRFVTWNVHSCTGVDGRHDPRRVGDVLEGLGADVIGLQEVDWRLPLVDDRHQLDLLAERLGLHAVAGHNLRDHRGEYGNGLLSRFDVRDVRRVELSHGDREPRGAIDATLDAPGGRLRVLVTHLGLQRRERLDQVRRLRRAVAPVGDEPTVLLGDLNEWRPGRLVPHLLVPDPFPAVALGRSYPSRLPAFALDRILVRPAPSSLSYRVVRSAAARAASDHLPVVADVEW